LKSMLRKELVHAVRTVHAGKRFAGARKPDPGAPGGIEPPRGRDCGRARSSRGNCLQGRAGPRLVSPVGPALAACSPGFPCARGTATDIKSVPNISGSRYRRRSNALTLYPHSNSTRQ
jgi:hypothetical protein